MRLLVFIIGIIFLPIFLSGQDETCSSKEDQARPAFYDEVIRNIQSRSSYTLALKISIISYDNGRRIVSESSVLDEVQIVNRYFAEHGIYFEVCGLDYIANSDLLKFQRIEDKPIISQYNEENKINVYIVEDILKTDGTSSCGFADFPWNTSEIIVVKKGCITNTSTLAHELGHFLGLYHTHHTSFGKELVNQSNCELAGDKICDTPADPILSNDNIDQSCTYYGTKMDLNSDQYEPDPSLVMSYSRKYCRNKFTEQQGAVMAFSIETYFNEYLCSTTSTFGPLNQEIKLFPNPTSGVLNIENPKKSRIAISIYNLQGQLLDAKVYQKFLDMSSFPAGIYLVQIRDLDSNLNALHKIVKY